MLFVAISLFGVSAYAEEPSICREPLKTVCQNTKPTQAKPLSRQITERTVAELNRFLGTQFQANTFVAQLKSELTATPNETVIRNWVLYMGCADYFARAYYSGQSTLTECFTGSYRPENPAPIETLITQIRRTDNFEPVNQIFETSKSLVRQVVERANLAEELKTRLLFQVEVMTDLNLPKELLRQIRAVLAGEKDKYHRMDWSEVGTVCDLSLEESNAENSGGNLLICPSAWFDAFVGSAQPNPDFMLGTFTHEMGHTIEEAIREMTTYSLKLPLAGLSRAKFQETLSCMTERFADTRKLLVRPPAFKTAKEREAFRRKLKFSPIKRNADLHYSEYSADQISAQAMAIYLNQISGMERKVELVNQNLGFGCDTNPKITTPRLESPIFEENNLHPPGPFRISEGYMNEESLRLELGCSPRARNQACALLAP